MRLECRDPDNGWLACAYCAAVYLIPLESSPPLLHAGPGQTVIHSNMQSVNTPAVPICPLHPPAAAVSPHQPGPDQWEVSPPSRPMGACHQALGQWEVSQCRDVPELRTNGRPQHPWCSTHDQPAPDMEKHGDKQANWFRPPRAKLNKYHFLLLFNLIT